MGRADFCAELNYCVGAHGDGMGAGEGGGFVDEGLLGSGNRRDRKAAGGCSHVDCGFFGCGLNQQRIGVCSEPPTKVTKLVKFDLTRPEPTFSSTQTSISSLEQFFTECLRNQTCLRT